MQIADPETQVHQHGHCLYGYALSRMKKPTIDKDLEQKALLDAVCDQKG